MPLGARIGSYEVIAKLGEGGMGAVYRARDTKLDRDVAIKILPDAFAHDADRLARFQREAKTLASLNHPHIAAIHGLEESDGVIALVMELVEGEDLAQRIARGALSLAEALPIARQIAEALEAAHQQGIIHRDLKPANITVRGDGTVKVLDFGLAKAIDPAGGSSPAASLSPTITSPAMTQAGIILGTAAYMAPEQARGKAVDKRADIWAFGVVLFEMLTGRRLFEGAEMSDTLAFVLTKEPDWSLLPASTTPPVQRLLRRCLEKDRTRRLADVADARLEIDEALLNPASGVIAPIAEGRGPRWRRAVPWAVAAGAMIGLAITLMAWAPWRRVAAATPIKLRAELGTAASLTPASGSVAVAPDGSSLVFVARHLQDPTSRNMLYLQRLDRFDAQPLAGTDGASAPFFSPDGAWIAFFTAGTLKKIPSGGGGVVSVCDAQSPRGGSWGDDGTIVFASSSGLMRVPAAGGRAEVLMSVKPGEAVPSTPQFLPGGRVLYTDAAGAAGSNLTISARTLATGTTKLVVQNGGLNPMYTASGHLTFVRNATLFAVPFDVRALETRGNPVPVIENVTTVTLGAGILSMSATGVFAFLPSATGGAAQGPVNWLDRTGTTALRAAPSTWGFPRFSPDGRHLALTISDGRQTDIWVYDWERDILTRITSDPAADVSPVWTPDGTRLAFGSNRGGGGMNIYWQRADGIGEAQRLTTSPVPQMPDAFHPDGRLLAFHQGDPGSNRQDLMVLPVEGDETSGWKPGTPTTFLGGPFLKASPRFSPDGRWLSYAAFDSGRFEIYVQPFPGPGGRVQISSGGGNLALWSPNKRELYYAGSGEGKMMVVPYSIAGNVFNPAKAQTWSEVPFSSPPPISAYGPGFDLHPSGQRFAVAAAATSNPAENRPSQLILIFNFFEELRRVAPLH